MYSCIERFNTFSLPCGVLLRNIYTSSTGTSCCRIAGTFGLGLVACFCRERGQPYFLYIALAHMHVPLAPPPGASATDDNKVYTTSLQEMDGLVGAIKSISDETDRDNTLIWFTG